MKGWGAVIVGGLVGAAVFVLWPVYTEPMGPRKATVALSNTKQIGTSFMIYAADFDDHLPPLATWARDLTPYLKNEEVFWNEREGGAKTGFAMSALAGGLDLARVEALEGTVMHFECAAGLGKGSGGPSDLYWDAKGHSTVGFLDSHARRIPRKDVGTLSWSPRMLPSRKTEPREASH